MLSHSQRKCSVIIYNVFVLVGFSVFNTDHRIEYNMYHMNRTFYLRALLTKFHTSQCNLCVFISVNNVSIISQQSVSSSFLSLLKLDTRIFNEYRTYTSIYTHGFVLLIVFTFIKICSPSIIL